MEGVALAASIMQIIDLGTRVVKKGFDVYNSADGQLIEHGEIETVAKSLAHSAAHIRGNFPANLTAHEREKHQIAIKCEQIATELLAALDGLKVKSRDRTGWPRKWKSIRQALKTVWHEDRIAKLESRLDRCRQQMTFNILEGLSRPAITLNRNRVFEAEKNVIRSLRFREMDDRESRISKAHQETFKWIYSNPRHQNDPHQIRSTFRAFLEQSDGGIYWITGKPGSGKSTLMKYLMHNDRTFQHLDRWEQESEELISSSFYFWNSGMDMQMSVEGLLQTILYQALKQLPSSLVREVFPARIEVLCLFREDYTPWTLAELEQALRKLVLDICPDRKFFFLIDGLDECTGDQETLTDILLDLSSSAGSNLKLCLASRPWTNFEDAFRGKPNLMLHHLTVGDIERYIRSTFHGSPGYRELEAREPQYAARLINEIAAKAEGVFLWVRLVVRSLLVGLTNGDRIIDLRKRVDRTPSNLEDLFRKMLASMEPQYLQHASQLFQIHRASRVSPTLLTTAFADLEEQNEAFSQLLWPLSRAQIVARCCHMKRKLFSRCKGLLEVAYHIIDEDPAVEDDYRIVHYRVQYLHRTVKDFLETPDIWEWIVRANREPFDPALALCMSHLLQLKIMVPGTATRSAILDHATWCIDYAKDAANNGEYAQTQVLNGLNATATALARSFRSQQHEDESEDDQEESHWTSDVIPITARVADPFLYFMAMCGMSGYLQATLRYRDERLLDPDGDVTPLLFAVVEDYLVLEQYSDRKSMVPGTPCLATIRVLLHKGADPRQLYRGRSARSIAATMANRGDREASSRAKSGTPLTAANLGRFDPTLGEGPEAGLLAANGSVLDLSNIRYVYDSKHPNKVEVAHVEARATSPQNNRLHSLGRTLRRSFTTRSSQTKAHDFRRSEYHHQPSSPEPQRYSPESSHSHPRRILRPSR
ncbi:hypothetical protein QBC40DRAFT_341612 [Triangularia verruculosa]|uniref:NACHT domain-containing protein n=1 Tax=Triangularia verruculosa TaxID=2587418 RepID=A0AAN6XC37_9PEZI|nr:hypothetical protein QBC40DRAFT_341612 [Triangularia verruculosa]